MHDFTVTIEHHPDLTLIEVVGEVDMITAPAVDEAALVVPFGGTLRLDLSGVSFMDSSGLNLLLRLRRRMQSEAGRLEVVGLQQQPSDLLHITGAYELVTVADDTGEVPSGRRVTGHTVRHGSCAAPAT
ncbi:STAS domain-containing protein [Streptomyces lavendofoliae]|uniref:STAS domain-containing protein n=1 Tax=Streptomyces lavendofoliae TaxID=67314 RepID=UPI00300EBC94